MLTQRVRRLFKKSNGKELGVSKIKRKLNVTNPKNEINEVLKKLLKEDFLTLTGRGNYVYTTLDRDKTDIETTQFTGVVDKTKTGSGYILIKELPYDVFIPNRYMMTAMDGDTVKIKLLFSKRGSRHEGRILEIVKRAKSQFIGTFRKFGNYASVIVESIKDELEIFVINTEGEFKDNDKVLIEIKEWRGKKHPVPWGNIVKTLDLSYQNDIEMKSILVNNGFRLDFDEQTIKETEKLTIGINQEEIDKRRDFRGITTFTIDPATAKDFDDALSIEYFDDGSVEIGVHIADVSHYVKEGTKLDEIAYEQATSVYLVDRVSPMLPEKLSNELCSLRPREESLTFSAVFKFDKNRNVISRWFGKTIIYSDHRFTYEEAQKILDESKGHFSKELADLNGIAHKLRKDRFKTGSVDFNTDEVVFELDEKSKPIGIKVKERLDAHKLVEEFMLLANKEVATYIYKKRDKKKIPFVYRVHDLPDIEKLAEFANFSKEFGIKMKLDNPQQVAKSFNNLSKMSEENESLKLLIPLALRTMAKAIYSTDNIGHYGLGFGNYTHFTSPIRRYSDVLVHRILYQNLKKEFITNKDKLEEKCRHISEQERKAVVAERESVKFMQVEYISDQIGNVFDGRITGFSEKGMYVEIIESKVEGMVEFSTMGQYFILDQSKYKVVGKKTGLTLKIGDPVTIKVIKTNLQRRIVDFEYIEDED